MKSAQVGISEWLVCTALWAADTRLGGRGNALYVFPTQVTMDDFAQARVDKAIEDSEYLRGRVGTVTYGGKSGVARVRLKRVGTGHLYFRGSDNRAQLLTIDADCLLLDEVDEFKENVLPTARQRLNSSLAAGGLGLERGASTPKYPSSGIAPIFAETTRRRYFLRCESCGERQSLRFPQNVSRGGELVCARCGEGLDRLAQGEWVAEQPGAEIEGYHVWRAYSPRTNLVELAKVGYAILDGLVSNPATIQEFYNQQLGQPHAPAGGSLTNDVLLACLRDYGHPSTTISGPVVMGVDVGAVLHYWIEGPAEDDTEQYGATKLLQVGTVTNSSEGWDELEAIWRRFGVHFGVIDAQPEGEKAARWCERAAGRRYRCFYPNMAGWKPEDVATWNHKEHVVQAHRTNSLDALFDRFYQQKLLLPREAPYLPGLFPHLTAPVRVLSRDADGRDVARYDEGSADDHYCHAANYANLAREFSAPRWGVKALTSGSYGYQAGNEPPDTINGRPLQIISRKKHRIFNEPGIDPFQQEKSVGQAMREADRIAREAVRMARLRGLLRVEPVTPSSDETDVRPTE